MGFGTVFAMLSFLLVFTGMVVMTVHMQSTFTDVGLQTAERQALLSAAQDEEITITDTSYSYGEEQFWVMTYGDEFAKGTTDGFIEIVGDGVASTFSGAGYGPGNFTSPIYDTGTASNFTTISYFFGAGALSMKIRSGSSVAGINAASFVGPDNTSTTGYDAFDTINETHDGDRYIQFQAGFSSNFESQVLGEVEIGVQRGSGHARLELENTGKTKLRFEETDTYIDGVRVQRDDSERVLHDMQIISNERLWDPGERLNITVFTNITTSKTITVTNRHAKDQAAVTA